MLPKIFEASHNFNGLAGEVPPEGVSIPVVPRAKALDNSSIVIINCSGLDMQIPMPDCLANLSDNRG